MTNFAFPFAAAGVLLVLLSLILFRHFRASKIAARKKRKRAVSETHGSSYADCHGHFGMRYDAGSCRLAGSEVRDGSEGSVTHGASGGDGAGDGRGN
jgi:hypothetical protein